EVKANLFKGLAHPVRIRLLELLSDSPELPVSALQAETELEASHLSQHLSVLRRHHLVVSERRGSHVFYRLADPRIRELLAAARARLRTMVSEDTDRLSEARPLPEIQGVHGRAEARTEGDADGRSGG